MSLDARSRSSIYQKFVPLLGEDDANTLMSEFPSVEADELVTKQFLRAELVEFRAELRAEMRELFHRQNLMFGSALVASTTLLATIGLFS